MYGHIEYNESKKNGQHPQKGVPQKGGNILTEKLQAIVTDIESRQTSIGIEFGSTRIKAVLIDSRFAPIASGSYEWENQLVEGIWTYSLDQIWKGLQTSYAELTREVKEKYGVTLTAAGSIGFSAMMHGYMAFNQENELLVPFRTWRNATTADAEKELTALFKYNIPQRWSIAHLYQAVLNKEEHTVFCKTFLHNIAKKKYTPLRLKFFSDYFGLDRAFLSRKLSPVKLKMCA